MAFGETERKCLLCLRTLGRQRREATVDSIAVVAKSLIGPEPVEWRTPLAALERSGLVVAEGDTYSLTEAGETAAERIHRDHPLWAYMYREVHARAPESAAYGTLCERVFGRNLCQQGQADMAQIDALVAALRISAEHRILDLGCGNGLLAAYIAERTGAHVTGVDLSAAGIDYAKAHAQPERGRVAFEVGNVNALAFPEASFDQVLSIDTLHLAADLRETLCKLAKILAPCGEMGIFWETWIRPEKRPREMLEPAGTRLGRTLVDLGWSYETRDFSSANDTLWERMKTALADLRSAFEAEGNGFLYESLLSQTRRTEWGVGSRYLYRVVP